MLTSARRLTAVALALVVAAGLTACGSDDEKPKATKPKPSASATTEPPYLPVPTGVTLTEPGTQLELGAQGVIAFQRRQSEVGVLEVTVQRIERTSFEESFEGWNVDDVTAARTPYFVRLAVTNVGEVDLGGMLLDNALWADDGTTLEAPNYYPADQQPRCPGGPLPEPFAAGATAELCQVYFIAPGRAFESVSFPPFGGLDAITWSGELSPVSKPKKGKKGKKADQDPTQSPAAESPATPAASPKPAPKPAAKPTATGKATAKPSAKSTRDSTSSSISKSTGGGKGGATGAPSSPSAGVTAGSDSGGGPSQGDS